MFLLLVLPICVWREEATAVAALTPVWAPNPLCCGGASPIAGAVLGPQLLLLVLCEGPVVKYS